MNRLIAGLLFLTFATAGWAQREPAPMPPTFSQSASIEQTLQSYPLGVISQQAAFSHHGGPHSKVRLANGLEGWRYDVGGTARRETYVAPGGERQSVRETEALHAVRSYTLVFDARGIVIDVLYNERGRHDGLTALVLQQRRGTASPMQAHPAPGPAK